MGACCRAGIDWLLFTELALGDCVGVWTRFDIAMSPGTSAYLIAVLLSRISAAILGSRVCSRHSLRYFSFRG